MEIYIPKEWAFWESLPKDDMLKKLQGEVAKWQAADTTTQVIPALHYIASTAQGAPVKMVNTACGCLFTKLIRS